MVIGNWNDGALGEATCITNKKGTCKVSLSGISIGEESVTFTIVNVDHVMLIYDAISNHDDEGDSDGTTITVSMVE
jgi:hypothetical protein